MSIQAKISSQPRGPWLVAVLVIPLQMLWHLRKAYQELLTVVRLLPPDQATEVLEDLSSHVKRLSPTPPSTKRASKTKRSRRKSPPSKRGRT
jgi:hypothetical protein